MDSLAELPGKIILGILIVRRRRTHENGEKDEAQRPGVSCNHHVGRVQKILEASDYSLRGGGGP